MPPTRPRCPGQVEDSQLVTQEDIAGELYAGIEQFNALQSEIASEDADSPAEFAKVGDMLHLVLLEITELGTRMYRLRSAAASNLDNGQANADMVLLPPLVLIVEDNALIRMASIDLVEEAGFRTVEASSADEAMAILDGRPDIRLVFTDVEMPGSMNGLRLVQLVQERWPPVHLVVESVKRIAAHELPYGSEFFLKPYDNGALIRVITAMLSGASPPVL